MFDIIYAGEPKKIETVKIETPLGTIESDSGNHMIDILTVVGIIGMLYFGKVLISRYFKK